ncbi:MAG: iron-containing redox enzyme family protein [Actinobacteria bacterium]|nr:iron-containing redox enzyme family protein [Actinomycetota bacterium]
MHHRGASAPGLPSESGPRLPAPRGPLSAELFAHLRGERLLATTGASCPEAVWLDDDAQLALYCCYEMHYRGFAGVAADAEWDPAVLGLRGRLEQRFLSELHDIAWPGSAVDPAGAEAHLVAMAAPGPGPSLSAWVLEHGTIAHLREFCIHRSAYQLKEADPHTWALPRLAGEAKAAMVQIQTDEYGQGCAGAAHAELFAETMQLLDLDPTYGAYLDRLPAAALATTNLVSLFGLHRRWRGALVGHLALFEMTSVGPMARYAEALERAGVPRGARRFYDVHVAVDAHHHRVALEHMVRGLLRDEPHLAGDVVFGAAALSAVEARFATHLLDAWRAGRPSLRPEREEPRDLPD